MTRALFLALFLGATPALADDVALIIGNRDYANGRDIRAADDIVDTAEDFEGAGFRVFSGEDLDLGQMRNLAQSFLGEADGAGRIVIALSGHFAHSGSRAWFLAGEADAPDLITAGAQGIELGPLLEIAARAPGQAVVLLGTEDRRLDLGQGLSAGLGTLAAPQGVAILRGEADDTADFAGGGLLRPDRGLGQSLERFGALSATGFISPTLPFVEEQNGHDAEVDVQPLRPELERVAWASALSENTIEAYERFLRRFPDGTNAASARSAMERLRDEPSLDARETEEALRLSRDERREIQRNLSLLEYDTRGIDGIFGRGTRGAVGAWQRTNGYDPTTFLTREQIERLDAQATRRAADLEAEAEARLIEQERADRAYWDETGARGDEDGLRAYLRRYPDGIFAEIAQERLRPFDERREAEARSADRESWERATERDTVEAYRRYLDDQPRGVFRDRAEGRIGELQRNSNDAADRAERALGLNQFTRNLVEARLDSLGLRPGRVDGVFDDNTRRAIRRYQSARNLPATGYLSQDTVVRLMADTILR